MNFFRICFSLYITPYKSDFSDIGNIKVITKKGLLPVTALGSTKRTKSLPIIWHRDKERIIQFDGFISKSNAGQVSLILDELFKKIDFKPGYGYRRGGNAELQEESQREVLKAGILATILTYMFLVALMNSFLHPFTISTTILTSFTGVFILMFFTNSSVDFFGRCYKIFYGAVFIGGMLGSILVTCLMIPLMYWYFERMKRFSIKKRREIFKQV